MAAPQQIDTLLKHAQSQEQQAQAQWLEIRRQVDAARSQLAELQRYVQEYESGRLSGALQVRALRNHQLFSDRLGEAVVQQSQTVRAIRQQEDQAKQIWQKQRCHLEALQLMRERRQAQQEQLGQRREQHRLDEVSGFIARVRPGARHA